MAKHDAREFDPRAWNLLAGAALLAGCSVRTVAGDGESSSETTTDDGGVIEEGTDTTVPTTISTTENDDSEPDDEGETHHDDNGDGDGDDGYYGTCGRCIEDYDCNPCEIDSSWVCENGTCVPSCQGQDSECDQFELCHYTGHCLPEGAPPPSCGFDEFDIPIIHDDIAPMALAFVDVDDDGADELVVANMTLLHVYEFGSDVPTISPRIPSNAPLEMVAGHFDAQPGEDVALLVVTDEIHTYSSDSVASFIMPSVEASPLTNPAKLLAGDFDGMAPDDLLLFGGAGALIDLGDATIPLIDEWVRDAAGFDHGTPGAGVATLGGDDTNVWDLMGNWQAQSGLNSIELGSMMEGDQPRYFTVIEHDSDNFETYWADVKIRALDMAIMFSILLPGDGARLNLYRGYVSGDFDGDGSDDLLASQGLPILTIVFDVFTQPCLVTQDLGGDPFEYSIAVGDHDGDGDDEVALIQGMDVLIVGVE